MFKQQRDLSKTHEERSNESNRTKNKSACMDFSMSIRHSENPLQNFEN